MRISGQLKGELRQYLEVVVEDDCEEMASQLSLERPACHDISLGAEKLN
jgi:hypothetical protein